MNMKQGSFDMRRMVVGMAMFCAVAIAHCMAADVIGDGLTCVAPLRKFGNLGPEQMVTHAFVLTNASDRLVQIGAVRLGCGCLTSMLATNVVPAGGSTELAATMSLAGQKGYQRKTIYVESDAGNRAPLRLEFEGNVVPPIEVMPEGIHFGAQTADRELEREVMVVAMGSALFQVKKVSSSSPQFVADVETVEQGKRYRLKVKCKGGRSPGTTTASLRVETDHPAVPNLDVPVTVFVAGDIVTAPATLVVIESATNSPRAYHVIVYSPDKKPFKVEKVTAPRDDIETRVTTISPDRYRVELNIASQVWELNGKTLLIETDMASKKEVTIPLRVISKLPK
jgi:hypothetical protein